MPSIRALAAPAVVAAALALGACGDDDEKSTTSASTPTTQASPTETTAETTSTETTEPSGGKYSAEEIQQESEKLSKKWTAKSQELTSSLASDPKSAKEKIGPFVDEFEKDYTALLDKVKNSDAPESVKSAIEQQKESLSKAFDMLKSQLKQLP
jgi:aconitase A